MKRQNGSILIIFTVTVLLAAAAIGIYLRQAKTSAPTATTTTPAMLTGFSYSPKSATDVVGFFNAAKTAANAVTWAGDWSQLDNGGPNGLVGAAKSSNLALIPIATTHTDSGGGKVRALRSLSENKASYVDKAAAYASKHKPAWMGLGIEINRLWESSAAEFEDFVTLFDQSYDRIKQVSPSTMVFTVFQLERVKGLHGGLFGGTNDTNKSQWNLLAKLGRADAYGFTSYPGLIYKTPSEIPSDYYTEVAEQTAKPVLFTELGWSSDMTIKGWESNPAEQEQFITKFADLTASIKPRVAIWSFLYDQKLPLPFTGMGLLASDGSAKLGWPAWQSYLRSR